MEFQCPLHSSHVTAQATGKPGRSHLPQTVDSKHSKHFGCWRTSQDLAEKDVWICKHVSALAKPLLKLCGASGRECPVNTLVLEWIWSVRSSSALFRTAVTMFRVVVMEKGHMSPLSPEEVVAAAAGVVASWADLCRKALSSLSLWAEMMFSFVLVSEPFWTISSDRTDDEGASSWQALHVSHPKGDAAG